MSIYRHKNINWQELLITYQNLINISSHNYICIHAGIHAYHKGGTLTVHLQTKVTANVTVAISRNIGVDYNVVTWQIFWRFKFRHN